MWSLLLSIFCISSQKSFAQHVSHHSPVIHSGNAKSFQTFTYFGRGHSPAPNSYTPAPAPAPFVPAPAPYVPAPAPYVPAPAPYVASPVSTQQLSSSNIRPYVHTAKFSPAPYKPAPAPYKPAPAPYKTTTVLYRNQAAPVKPVAPVFAQNTNYRPNIVRKPVVSRFRNVQSRYQPTASPSFRNGGNTFTTTEFTTTPFVPSVLRLDVPAAQIVDNALNEVNAEGPRIVSVLKKLQGNRLIKRFLVGNQDDPCTLIPENIAEVAEKLIAATVDARSSLVAIVESAQEMKRNEDNTELVLQEASKALLAIDPLLPVFTEIFPQNAGCDSSIKSTINGLDTIGGLLEVLGTTNLVSSDAQVKSKITKGGQSSKILGDLARKLEADNLTTLCADSPTFSSDVFMGVGELLNAFKKIGATFESDEISNLDKTIETIKDGAVSFSYSFFYSFSKQPLIYKLKCLCYICIQTI